MAKAFSCLFAAVAAFGAFAEWTPDSMDAVYVDPALTSDIIGVGDSWGDCLSLSNALQAVKPGGTIYVKAGEHVCEGAYATTKPVTIKGGYKGASGTSEELADDPMTVLHGKDNSVVTTILSVTAASGTFHAERLTFRNAYQRGLSVTGGVNVELANCAFIQNAWANTSQGVTGRALYLTGTATSTATISDCLMATNVVRANKAYNGAEDGCGLYAKTFQRLTLTGTTFLRNGLDGTGSGRDKTAAGGIYISGASVTATRCRFLNLTGETHNSSDYGAMLLAGGCGGSTFVNCLWAKTGMSTYSGTAGAGATVAVSLGAKAQTVLFDRCTFAYSSIDRGANRCGAVYVATGTVTVRNSIAWGNARTSETDFAIGTSGVLNLDNSIIGGTGSAYVKVNSGGTFNPGANIFEDPLFATDAAAAGGLAAEKIDFHVKSKVGRLGDGAWVADEVHSPAIDAATTDVDCSAEPEPNGGIANLGFYGGTAEASKSEPVAPAIADVTVRQDDYTRPAFDITLGGEGGYRADVYLCLGFAASAEAGTNGWPVVRLVASAVGNGETVTGIAPDYYDKGTKLCYRAVAIRGNLLAAAQDGDVTLVNDPPPFRGKGGGEHIIHLREGAVGNGTGTNWEHAVTTLAAALALLSETKNEIWVAGRCPLGGTTSASRAFTLRGGFAGAECAADERTEGLVSTIDGEGTASGLAVTASSGTFEAERIVFYNALSRNLKVTGGANIALAKCRIEKGAWNNVTDTIQGRGAYLTGSSSATLTISDCAFVTNVIRSTDKVGSENGCGLYAKTFRRITMDRTDFICNGNGGSRSGRDGTRGSGVYIEAAPVTARNCRFLGLVGMTHNANADGGAMTLAGACGGSAFTNCCWVGGTCKSYQGLSAYGATMLLMLSAKANAVDFEKCTFAFNHAYGASGAALMANVGTANVRNSIFWGNIATTANGAAGDLYAGASGALYLDHCIQAGEGNGRTAKAAGGTLEMTSMTTNAPLFATALAAYDASVPPETIDLHVHSTVGRWCGGAWVTDEDHSPAIDSATADADFALEPEPNGGVANLGFYGGTAEASKSVEMQPAVTNVVVTEPDYTRPSFDIMLGGEGNYHVSVWLCLGTTAGSADGTNGWTHVVEVSPYAGNGDTVKGRAPAYFATGDELHWNAVAMTGEGRMFCRTGMTTITGANPPFRGHGGGERIIHLRADAAGDGTGTNWEHAVSTFAEALARVKGDGAEIWVAGTCPLGRFAAPTNTLVIRGGFTGTEDALASRTAGARATLDGADVSDGLWFGAESGTNRVEGIWVRNCLKNGIRSTAGASLEIVDSVVSQNGRDVQPGAGMNGRGLYVTGRKADTTLVVSNALIVGNRALSSGDNDTGNYGHGAYLANLKRAYFCDTIVATNGLGINSNGSRSYAYGAAIYSAAPLTMVRTRVLGHGACTHDGDKGGIVWLAGGAGGSAFTNCLFMGNGSTRYQGGFNGGGSGAVVASIGAQETFELVNCTVAFNYSHGTTAGLWVRGGIVRVIDSLFWGNVTGLGGSDVRQGGGTLQLTRTLFGGTNAAYLAINDATRANMEKCVFGDPIFVTTTNEFAAALTADALGAWPTLRTQAGFRSEATACGFNVHVRSANGYDDETTGARIAFPRSDGRSPAINAGERGTLLQPEPNGTRRNLGFWGGTPYATRFVPVGTVLFVR